MHKEYSKLILKKLIGQINSKYKICLASHCVLPFDIVEEVDFYFYDKNCFCVSYIYF